MHNEPRQKLRKLLIEYGRSLCDDPRRCEALLKDYCGHYKREIFVLVSALRNRVADDLLKASSGVPQSILLARLNKQLEEELAMTPEAAHWAVESWALALGVFQQSKPMLKPAHIPIYSPHAAEVLLADRYQDNGDGTVTDRRIGLQWMRFAFGQKWNENNCMGEAKEFTWQSALDTVDLMNCQGGYANYCDWRVPTKEELLTLVYCSNEKPKAWNDTGNPCQGNYQRPTIHQQTFPNTSPRLFWSSSTDIKDPAYAWSVYFGGGYLHASPKKYEIYVRLVRGR